MAWGNDILAGASWTLVDAFIWPNGDMDVEADGWAYCTVTPSLSLAVIPEAFQAVIAHNKAVAWKSPVVTMQMYITYTSGDKARVLMPLSAVTNLVDTAFGEFTSIVVTIKNTSDTAVKLTTYELLPSLQVGTHAIEHMPGGQDPILSLVPTGAVVPYVSDSAPAGWLACDGSLFSRLTYPALATLLGDKFGVHSGDNYYLPNLTGRVPVGINISDAALDTIGETGGDKTIALTAANMPTHNHTIAHTHSLVHTHTIAHNHSMTHTHTIAHTHQPSDTTASFVARTNTTPNYVLATSGGTTSWKLFSTTSEPSNANSGASSAATTGGTSVADTGAASTSTTSAASSSNSGDAGSGTAHSNMQPYLVLLYIIKT